MMKRASAEQLKKEFDRQVKNLIEKGYPQVAGLEAGNFLRHIEPLRERAEKLSAGAENLVAGRLPFVIVVKSACFSLWRSKGDCIMD